MAHPDGVCHLVGFADHEFNTKTYLMLQRGFEFDEQDVELGMGTYHIEWCGQENSGYGGISQFLLERNCADITFTSGTAEALGGMERLTISFQLMSPEHSALREALEFIFEGSGCLSVADAWCLT
ncbi:MAG: Imm10 family immunity protein [Proteobacteria bacterium]|nr:Imm10 family immunity protein [Pseudomonadota bacterium]